MSIGHSIGIVGIIVMLFSVLLFYYKEFKSILKEINGEIPMTKRIGLILMIIGIILMFIVVLLPFRYF